MAQSNNIERPMDWLSNTNVIRWTKAKDIHLEHLAYKFPTRTPFTQAAEIQQIETCIKQGYPRLALRDLREETLSVVGYGPSLQDTWQLITHPCITVSGALDFLQHHDVIPDFHTECDGRDYKTKHLEHPNKKTKYFMASVCNPRMWELLAGCHVEYWHMANGQHVVDWIGEHDAGSILIAGGSNIGLTAIHLGGILGFRKFKLFGFDGNYRGDVRHAGVHYAAPQKRLVRIANGKRWETSPQMFNACDEFLKLYENQLLRFEIVGNSLLLDLVDEIDYAKAFWTDLWSSFTLDVVNELRVLRTAAEMRRARAEFNTGSVNEVSSVILKLLTDKLKPKVVVEIGTFIGNSTYAMQSAGHIYTCDHDNDCVDSTERITCYPRKSSVEMMGQLVDHGIKADMFFIDGRLRYADIPLILRLAKPSTVFVFDDYRGREKGVTNVEFVRPYYAKHKFVPACGIVSGITSLAVLTP